MGIEVMKKEDGFWLHFTSPNGNHALISVNEKILTKKKDGIINDAVLETCEALVNVKAPDCYKPSPIVEKMIAQMEETLKNIRVLKLNVLYNYLVEWIKVLRGGSK